MTPNLFFVINSLYCKMQCDVKKRKSNLFMNMTRNKIIFNPLWKYQLTPKGYLSVISLLIVIVHMHTIQFISVLFLVFEPCQFMSRNIIIIKKKSNFFGKVYCVIYSQLITMVGKYQLIKSPQNTLINPSQMSMQFRLSKYRLHATQLFQ